MSSVNAVVAWAGSVALFTLAALVFGPFLLRLFGLATMLVPTVFLFSEANLNTADAGSYLVFVPMAFIGLGLWVLGHRLHRAQHGWWKTPLAERLWSPAGPHPAPPYSQQGAPAWSRWTSPFGYRHRPGEP